MAAGADVVLTIFLLSTDMFSGFISQTFSTEDCRRTKGVVVQQWAERAGAAVVKSTVKPAQEVTLLCCLGYGPL